MNFLCYAYPDTAVDFFLKFASDLLGVRDSSASLLLKSMERYDRRELGTENQLFIDREKELYMFNSFFS